MPKKLPYRIFQKTFKYVPRAAISLLIKNSKGEVLLTKRRSEPFAGYWHLPGSFIIKNETINGCIKRIYREELGVQAPKDEKLLGVFEDISDDPRGHVIDIIYGFEISNKTRVRAIGLTKEASFFKKLPGKIGFNHRQTLQKLGYY